MRVAIMQYANNRALWPELNLGAIGFGWAFKLELVWIGGWDGAPILLCHSNYSCGAGRSAPYCTS